MKPIGNNAGGDVSAGPGGTETIPQAEPNARGRIRSSNSARLEDIIGAAPITSSPVAVASAVTSSPDADSLLATSETVANAFRPVRSVEQAYPAAMSVLGQLFGCPFAGHFTASQQKIGQVDRVVSFTNDSEGPVACVDICKSALRHQTAVAEVVDESIIAATIVRGTPLCIVAEFPLDCGADAISVLQLIAARLSELSITALLHASANASMGAAALVELVSLASSESTERAAQQRLADELQKHLNADDVFVGTCRSHQPACRLVAASTVAEIDEFCEMTQHVESVMQESIARSAASVWPAENDGDRHSLLAHQNLASEKRMLAIAATPLRSESGDVVGSVVATFGDPATAKDLADAAVKFLHAGSRPVGTAVEAIHRSHVSSVGKWKEQIRRVIGGNRALAAAAAICVLAGIFIIPVDYQVSCDTILQPVSRRYVAAPFAAPLQTCEVDPGDLVEENQLLAVLDGRELRWELAGLRADLGKASKEHNAHLSKQDYGDAAIARHEIDRLENRSLLLGDREKNLEIRSPISGVVVSGSLREREGVPLETGQSLFEVAPLDRMILEVAIPEEDMRHVEVDMSIRMQLDSMPSETLEAVVLRIHPKAELRDHQNVFIAEAEVSNVDLLLRPGMKGTASISTGRRMLGWNLFHKPVAHAIGWLGW